ncbi:uroporphyrinogen-III C-methyltransferase [Marinivivus vitaminiproducens]|uniref:uroporphyrinogen-III C-methyltransferase n=1 Tax=Marinivivus vitaminiproducens TaxID=3035935 RepID=UPI0027A4B198|nr:uroporphyrinogen-III C-methyltransferase [Geminicoccaceae bacterium SCSIO 64248]
MSLSILPSARPLPAAQVYLVGAGPGDAELLTVRAVRVLAVADVVIYDRLVGPDVLDLVRADAERLFVGKMRGRHALSQDRINALLVDRARAGRRVVRLKGGDPFVFGRGGEEALAVAHAGLPLEIVPGITAASGCGAFAGIPLSHRDVAHSVVFVTAQSRAGMPPLDWQALARPFTTVVVFMGLAVLAEICERLLAHGAPPDRPTAVVENGSLPEQRVIEGTLASIAGRVREAAPAGPCLIVIGDAVGLRRSLSPNDELRPRASDLETILTS